ncbi:MAG: hypothetical protein AABX75_01815 [Nanoarchaeota archaeon]
MAEEFEVGSPLGQLKRQLRDLKTSSSPAMANEHLDSISQRLTNIENNFNSLIDVLKQASQATEEESDIKNKVNELSEQNKILIEAVNELLKLLTTVFKTKDFSNSELKTENREPRTELHPKLQAGMPISYQRTR